MVPWLGENDHNFPLIKTALDDPNGLIAAGGDLSPQRLISAYKRGIFPWYNDDQPILWWSPAPRCVLTPDKIHISRSLAKQLRKNQFRISFNQSFADVIQQCSISRQHQEGTWITSEMQRAYLQLHHLGIAHSVEAWIDDELVGGLYGLAIGNIFFGESMFSRRSNASKVAFCQLAQQLQEWDFKLIDCQIHSNHLQSLGAYEISREHFQCYLDAIEKTLTSAPRGLWQ